MLPYYLEVWELTHTNFSQGGEVEKIIGLLRDLSHVLVDKASPDQLKRFLKEGLESGLSVSSPLAPATTKIRAEKPKRGNGRLPRLPSKKRKEMSREDANKIREAVANLSPDSNKYQEKRDVLCRRLGYTPRQFGNAVSGLKRAQSRRQHGGQRQEVVLLSQGGPCASIRTSFFIRMPYNN